MKKRPPKREPTREKKTYFLLTSTIDAVQVTARRLDIAPSRVIEALVGKHANALQVRVE